MHTHPERVLHALLCIQEATNFFLAVQAKVSGSSWEKCGQSQCLTGYCCQSWFAAGARVEDRFLLHLHKPPAQPLLYLQKGPGWHPDKQHAIIIISKTQTDPAFYSISNLNTDSSHTQDSDSRNFPGEAGTGRLDILVQIHLWHGGCERRHGWNTMQECVSVSKCSSMLLLWKYSRLRVLSPTVEIQLLPNSGECLICAAESHILFGIHISNFKDL